MKKLIFLMPVYNDWQSLIKLLNEINAVIKDNKDFEFKCIIVNDSSSVAAPKISKPNNFNSLKIINMKKNRGHARCNAAGLRFINFNEVFDYVIVMDSDGEDRPIEINDMIKKITDKNDISVVAKRIKRSEGILFKSLYQLHKLITYVFTGKNINFGNYSCLTKRDIKAIIDKPSLWSSFSGTVKKYLPNLNEVKSIRGLRYFGPSKMSLFSLAIHSFSIMAVFKFTIFIRSSVMIMLLSFFVKKLGLTILFLLIMLIIFNLLIFIVSMRESKQFLLKSNENILDINDIVH